MRRLWASSLEMMTFLGRSTGKPKAGGVAVPLNTMTNALVAAIEKDA